MDIYDRIDAVLKEKHMSRRQLAQTAGLNSSTLAAAFARRSQMPYSNIVKIAKVLQVSPCELEPQFDSIANLHTHAEESRSDLDTFARHFFLIQAYSDEFKLNNILEDIKKPSRNIDIFYDILAGVCALNENAQRKVLDYVLDLNAVYAYRSEVAQMASAAMSRNGVFSTDKIIKMERIANDERLPEEAILFWRNISHQEVTPCPEEELPTAAEHSPGSDPTDAGK